MLGLATAAVLLAVGVMAGLNGARAESADPPETVAELDAQHQAELERLTARQAEEMAALIATRPFRSPHHTISDVALVGGGSHPHPSRNRCFRMDTNRERKGIS